MSLVVIAKGKDITKRTKAALEKLNPKLPSKGKILIKPNLVEPMDKNSGAITRPEVVEGIVEFLLPYGFKIYVGEGCAYTNRTKECFEKADYYKLAEKYDVKIVCFDPAFSEFIPSKLNLKIWKEKEIKIAKLVEEVNYIISAAVLKEHGFAVTLSCKNMMGILEQKGYYPNKAYMHKENLEEVWTERLCDLLANYKPDLGIIDGTTAMFGSHLYGKLKELNLTIAGEDPLAVDIVGAKILGHSSVFYLNKLLERKIGKLPSKIIKIEV